MPRPEDMDDGRIRLGLASSSLQSSLIVAAILKRGPQAAPFAVLRKVSVITHGAAARPAARCRAVLPARMKKNAASTKMAVKTANVAR